MLKLDLPFEEDNETELISMGDDERAAPRLRGLMGEPLAGLCALVGAFLLIDGTRHVACRASAGGFCGAAEGPFLALLILATILGAGFLLKASFDRYLRTRTQVLAAVIAALPFAHLLASVHDDPPAGTNRDAAIVRSFERSERSREALRDDVAALAVTIDEQRSMIERQAETIARQEEALAELTPELIADIAAREAARALDEGSEVFEARLAEQEDDLLSELVDRERRLDALRNVADRIAAAGPIERTAANGEEIVLSRDVVLIADHLGLEGAERQALGQDEDLSRCINVRKAERGPFAVMNHRLNPERYAEYLASCVTE